ncbi:MAG TPA: inositol monophosphatase [Jatrophihabitans sp.]|nr:inositol monophosphatase [Jatrophihabitans sp.]
MTLADDLALAESLVRDAGNLAARMLAGGLETFHKTSISDVVSAADHEAEKLIVSRLRQARPDDGLIGEEGTAHPSASGRTWVIDPVDGTYNFLSGIPLWCSAVGLAERDAPDQPWRPLLGAVYHPDADELWSGGPGNPTRLNGRPVPPLDQQPLDELSLVSYLHPAALDDPAVREPLLRAMSGAATVRMLGSGSVELAAVAGGRLGAWVQRNSLDWDWLPGAALVLGAGGSTRLVPHRGLTWHLAGNARAVADVARLLVG